MNKNMLIGLVVVIVVLIGGAFMFMNQTTTTNPSFTPAGTTVANASPNPAAGIEQTAFDSDTIEIDVESKGLVFNPGEIRVKRGQTVKINYTNTMGNHDWVVDEFNARTPIIGAGETASVTFVADEAGTFEFYCSVPGHREAGMKGNLIVIE